MNNFISTLGIFLVAAVAFAAFFCWPVMWLWNNCLVGAIDGINKINFASALGITILIGLLTYRPTTKQE